ncbi:MAG: DUF2383 domain-containing protein [Methylobacter sp.]|uniref:DUF2383 domain-containing protein n=1 Tax=Methylobacter sp. TaxID=2051955 RepID=UPI00272F7BD4|nr:DUF2383 domain-containing protein [Methylobacter sp.]MDP1665158.1 DUF2383 domain-containing protein [Methylobacter sp.]
MHDLETLNKLLKDELAATETYQQVLNEFRENTEPGEAKYLMLIYKAHKDVVSRLQAQICQLGGTPRDISAAWITWTTIVLKGANLLGKRAILKTLQKEEQRGAEKYKQALHDIELPSYVRSLIEWKLLYAQQSHLRTLNQLLSGGLSRL